jgi:hypothetical protein
MSRSRVLSPIRTSRLRQVRRALLMVPLMLLVMGSVSAFAQSTVDMTVQLREPETLTIIPCEITVTAGDSVTGNLNNCVIGGNGVRSFGPVGIEIPCPDGGVVTIAADGTFTYRAGLSGGSTTFPFTVDDATTESPLPGLMTVTVVVPLQIASPTLHVAAGAVIHGNLNDYVTGGHGPRVFGPIGVEMTTPAGGHITINGDGTFTYRAPDHDATDTIGFTVIDDSVTAPLAGLMTIVVTADAPTPAEATPVITIPGTSGGIPVASLPDTGDASMASSARHDEVSVLLLIAFSLVLVAFAGRARRRIGGGPTRR